VRPASLQLLIGQRLKLPEAAMKRKSAPSNSHHRRSTGGYRPADRSLPVLEWIRRISKAAAHPSKLLSRAKQRLKNRYRPELHYMRGPGPKMREKLGRNEPEH
jgi:hypothetical protein